MEFDLFPLLAPGNHRAAFGAYDVRSFEPQINPAASTTDAAVAQRLPPSNPELYSALWSLRSLRLHAASATLHSFEDVLAEQRRKTEHFRQYGNSQLAARRTSRNEHTRIHTTLFRALRLYDSEEEPSWCGGWIRRKTRLDKIHRSLLSLSCNAFIPEDERDEALVTDLQRYLEDVWRSSPASRRRIQSLASLLLLGVVSGRLSLVADAITSFKMLPESDVVKMDDFEEGAIDRFFGPVANFLTGEAAAAFESARAMEASSAASSSSSSCSSGSSGSSSFSRQAKIESFDELMCDIGKTSVADVSSSVETYVAVILHRIAAIHNVPSTSFVDTTLGAFHSWYLLLRNLTSSSSVVQSRTQTAQVLATLDILRVSLAQLSMAATVHQYNVELDSLMARLKQLLSDILRFGNCAADRRSSSIISFTWDTTSNHASTGLAASQWAQKTPVRVVDQQELSPAVISPDQQHTFGTSKLESSASIVSEMTISSHFEKLSDRAAQCISSAFALFFPSAEAQLALVTELLDSCSSSAAMHLLDALMDRLVHDPQLFKLYLRNSARFFDFLHRLIDFSAVCNTTHTLQHILQHLWSIYHGQCTYSQRAVSADDMTVPNVRDVLSTVCKVIIRRQILSCLPVIVENAQLTRDIRLMTEIAFCLLTHSPFALQPSSTLAVVPIVVRLQPGGPSTTSNGGACCAIVNVIPSTMFLSLRVLAAPSAISVPDVKVDLGRGIHGSCACLPIAVPLNRSLSAHNTSSISLRSDSVCDVLVECIVAKTAEDDVAAAVYPFVAHCISACLASPGPALPSISNFTPECLQGGLDTHGRFANLRSLISGVVRLHSTSVVHDSSSKQQPGEVAPQQETQASMSDDEQKVAPQLVHLNIVMNRLYVTCGLQSVVRPSDLAQSTLLAEVHVLLTVAYLLGASALEKMIGCFKDPSIITHACVDKRIVRCAHSVRTVLMGLRQRDSRYLGTTYDVLNDLVVKKCSVLLSLCPTLEIYSEPSEDVTMMPATEDEIVIEDMANDDDGCTSTASSANLLPPSRTAISTLLCIIRWKRRVQYARRVIASAQALLCADTVGHRDLEQLCGQASAAGMSRLEGLHLLHRVLESRNDLLKNECERSFSVLCTLRKAPVCAGLEATSCAVVRSVRQELSFAFSKMLSALQYTVLDVSDECAIVSQGIIPRLMQHLASTDGTVTPASVDVVKVLSHIVSSCRSPELRSEILVQCLRNFSVALLPLLHTLILQDMREVDNRLRVRTMDAWAQSVWNVCTNDPAVDFETRQMAVLVFAYVVMHLEEMQSKETHLESLINLLGDASLAVNGIDSATSRLMSSSTIPLFCDCLFSAVRLQPTNDVCHSVNSALSRMVSAQQLQLPFVVGVLGLWAGFPCRLVVGQRVYVEGRVYKIVHLSEETQTARLLASDASAAFSENSGTSASGSSDTENAVKRNYSMLKVEAEMPLECTLPPGLVSWIASSGMQFPAAVQAGNLVRYLVAKCVEHLPSAAFDADQRVLAWVASIAAQPSSFDTTYVDRISSCTYCTTGKNFEVQHWFHCLTCGIRDREGVCVFCARTCHRGHSLVYARSSSFVCDCSLNCHKTKCQSMKSVQPRVEHTECSLKRAVAKLAVVDCMASKGTLELPSHPQHVPSPSATTETLASLLARERDEKEDCMNRNIEEAKALRTGPISARTRMAMEISQMGFSLKDAEHALAVNNDDANSAAAWLLEHSTGGM